MGTFMGHVEIEVGTTAMLIGRLIKNNNLGLFVVDVLEWNLGVYDLDSTSPEEPVWSIEEQPNGSPPFFASFQLDSYWTLDTNGYNFRTPASHQLVPWEGGKRYRAELEVFTPGENYRYYWIINVLPSFAPVAEGA
jgi:hypothetical protein